MSLSNAVLLPRSLMPLYIFEPKYKRMLRDVLARDRVFCVAMQQPGYKRTTPFPTAGLGLVRAAVRHKNGTYHVIMQGVARIKLGQAVGTVPYWTFAYTTVPPPAFASDVMEPYLEALRDIARTRLELGAAELPMPFPKLKFQDKPKEKMVGAMMAYLNGIKDPVMLTDTIAGSVLSTPAHRQIILESSDMEERIQLLLACLGQEIKKLQEHDDLDQGEPPSPDDAPESDIPF